MTPLRTDLLELSTTALIALTNAGFVKKAQKDLDGGQIPQITQAEDGTIHAMYTDGHQASLPPQRALREAECTCPASGLCRHRVTLVLAYQRLARAEEAPATPTASTPREDTSPTPAATQEQTPWSPAGFDNAQLAESLSASILAQAASLAAERPVATVLAWTPENPSPSVRLPMCSVRFFSRTSLASAHCDCKDGSPCVHLALAIWAFRQAEQEKPGELRAVVEIQPPAHPSGSHQEQPMDAPEARELQHAIYAWLQQIWQEGSSQPLNLLKPSLAYLQKQVSGRGWCWVQETLEEIWQQLEDQEARSSRFIPRRLLETMAQLWGRLQSAETIPTPPILPPRQILGMGVRGEQALDHLRLVSLGLSGWHDDGGAGAEIAFADPDTQTLMMLQRYWPHAPGDTAQPSSWADLMGRRAGGQRLDKLASSQVITKAAKRRANGIVDLNANARQTNLFPLSPKAWDELGAPIRLHRVDTLIHQLQQETPDFAAPAQAIKKFHILALPETTVEAWGWDGARQTLCAQLRSASNDTDLPLSLQLQHNGSWAVDVAARALQGEWGQITALGGNVWLAHGQLFMRPWTLMTQQRALVLEAEASSTEALAPPISTAEPSPGQHAIEATLELLTHWLRRGIRHQTQGSLTQLENLANSLQQQGLHHCASQLKQLGRQIQAHDRENLLAGLSSLILFLNTCSLMVDA